MYAGTLQYLQEESYSVTDITLSASTGSTTVDDMLRGIIGIFEMMFPDRIHTYYIEGSYANGTEVTASDLDLTIVFKDSFHDDLERDIAIQFGSYCTAVSGVELDIDLVDDGQLAAGVYPSLKMGSRCIYGEDRRADLPLLSLEAWTRERIHAAYWLLVTVFHRPRSVTYPLSYPDPVGRFYGYDHRMVRLAMGTMVNSTRDLIRVTGWIATALLAYRAGIYVARKSDCHHAYRRHINDSWASLLDDLYQQCRTEWGYYIPTGVPEQQILRDLCQRTLQFENYFLTIYKEYLLAELRSDDEVAQGRALWVLSNIVYRDEDIRRAVQALDGPGECGVQQAAKDTLMLFQQD